MNLLAAIFVGFGVGWFGNRRGWTFTKIFVVGFSVGVVLNISWILFNSPAEGSEPYNLKLKDNTARMSNGSGFIFKGPSGKQYLVTNYHVCLGGSWHNVATGSLESGEVVRGGIVKRDIKPDLCAALIERRKAPLELAKELKPDTRVYTRGYPYGVLSQSKGKYIGITKWSYMFPIEQIGECPSEAQKDFSGDGILAGCETEYTDNVTDLYARPGSSGSPVVNFDGDLVGVMSSWDSGKDAGGMVRLEDIKEFFKGL